MRRTKICYYSKTRLINMLFIQDFIRKEKNEKISTNAVGGTSLLQ
jgi:hypothetical protein